MMRNFYLNAGYARILLCSTPFAWCTTTSQSESPPRPTPKKTGPGRMRRRGWTRTSNIPGTTALRLRQRFIMVDMPEEIYDGQCGTSLSPQLMRKSSRFPRGRWKRATGTMWTTIRRVTSRCRSAIFARVRLVMALSATYLLNSTQNGHGPPMIFRLPDTILSDGRRCLGTEISRTSCRYLRLVYVKTAPSDRTPRCPPAPPAG